MDTSPQSERVRARDVRLGGSPWDAQVQCQTHRDEHAALKKKRVYLPKQAPRPRHPHNLSADEPVMYALAAPAWSAHMTATLP